MSLHDIDASADTVAEIARMLEPGGRFCLAIVHPLNRPPAALDDYFVEHRFAEEVELDGLQMTFEGIDRPLEAYTQALSRVGFRVEELREPKPNGRPGRSAKARQGRETSPLPPHAMRPCALTAAVRKRTASGTKRCLPAEYKAVVTRPPSDEPRPGTSAAGP